MEIEHQEQADGCMGYQYCTRHIQVYFYHINRFFLLFRKISSENGVDCNPRLLIGSSFSFSKSYNYAVAVYLCFHI